MPRDSRRALSRNENPTGIRTATENRQISSFALSSHGDHSGGRSSLELMGALSREIGVLKLIHPGRHVEVHTQPVPAIEVLKKYPRYCITRPDVFKFPWIVVKPDSILVPGRVFFLVPKHTVYRLLKSDRHSNLPSPSRRIAESPANNQRFRAFDNHRTRSSYRGIENCNDKEDECRDVKLKAETALKDESERLNQGSTLKPCLKKPDSSRRPGNLRVRFALPEDEKDEPRPAKRVGESPAESAAI